LAEGCGECGGFVTVLGQEGSCQPVWKGPQLREKLSLPGALLRSPGLESLPWVFQALRKALAFGKGPMAQGQVGPPKILMSDLFLARQVEEALQDASVSDHSESEVGYQSPIVTSQRALAAQVPRHRGIRSRLAAEAHGQELQAHPLEQPSMRPGGEPVLLCLWKSVE